MRRIPCSSGKGRGDDLNEAEYSSAYPMDTGPKMERGDDL